MSDDLPIEDAPLNRPIRKRGRPRNSPEQDAKMLAERKEKYWGPERNAKRREAYSSDPSYAEKQRTARRASHARSSGKEPNQSCIDNLKLVGTSGALRAIRAGSSAYVIGRVFTQSDAARMLDRQPQVIYRWQQRGIFPPPTLVDDTGSTFYTDDEVSDFIIILGEHQLQTPHYRIDHVAVRDRLFAAAFHHRPEVAAAWVEARR